MPYYLPSLDAQPDTFLVPLTEQPNQEKHVTFADDAEITDDIYSQDPNTKQNGIAESREPNEGYHGGSKDGLFAERYSKEVPQGLSAAGAGDGGEKRGNSSGGGTGGNNGGGGGRRGGGYGYSGTTVKYSSSTSGSSTSQSSGQRSRRSGTPERFGDRVLNASDKIRVPYEENASGIITQRIRFNKKGQRVMIEDHRSRLVGKMDEPPKKGDSKWTSGRAYKEG